MVKKNNLVLGLILGIIAPFLGMALFYYWKFKPLTFSEFLQFANMQRSIITGMVSFSLMMNAILFTIFINTKKDQTAIGIFIVTCIYAIAVLIYRWAF
ncbi:hypothetical protein [Foetidibacter luteolus]|uniref:hypothetical protein n=1 Tax=Foetidibacter luteolus TaxID=2608880 RepID=UPI00129B5D10|nr:hypothetical protein [Foetidibacter luteolus]